MVFGFAAGSADLRPGCADLRPDCGHQWPGFLLKTAKNRYYRYKPKRVRAFRCVVAGGCGRLRVFAGWLFNAIK